MHQNPLCLPKRRRIRPRFRCIERRQNPPCSFNDEKTICYGGNQCFSCQIDPFQPRREMRRNWLLERMSRRENTSRRRKTLPYPNAILIGSALNRLPIIPLQAACNRRGGYGLTHFRMNSCYDDASHARTSNIRSMSSFRLKLCNTKRKHSLPRGAVGGTMGRISIPASCKRRDFSRTCSAPGK